jgi:putative transposase
MERKFSFSIDEFYHIYNRGTDKRIIFKDEKDYQRFINLLYLLNNKDPLEYRLVTKKLNHYEIFNFKRGPRLVSIGAYCLMPNHFHLLIKEETENGISAFMLKILTGYSMYFNKKYKRTGSLFEGPFKATHLDSDDYLKYIYSYIHLNPIKLIDYDWKEKGIRNIAEAKDFLSKYSHSSYWDSLGEGRPERKILNPESFPDYFLAKGSFEDEINDWLEISKEF